MSRAFASALVGIGCLAFTAAAIMLGWGTGWAIFGAVCFVLVAV